MKSKDLLHALNEIDGAYIQDANEAKFKNRRRGRAAVRIAIAACICIIVGAGYFISRLRADKTQDKGGSSGETQPHPGQSSQTGVVSADFAIARANYPECAPYPDEAQLDGDFSQEAEDNYRAMMTKWVEERRERIGQSEVYQGDLYPFYKATMQEFLVSEENTNQIYSPLNLYIALSMLTELTDGNSRAQILDLLGAPDVSAVRKRAAALWTANYCDDGMVTSILANSLWMRQGVNFIPETIQTLADVYHASSFQGEMGSEEFTQAFHSWLNAQTGGLLSEQVQTIKMEERTVLELASTIYYSAQWQDRFDEEKTWKDIFHKADGDISCDFMHRLELGICYRGSNFSAVSCGLRLSGNMWLFLPEEDVNVREVVENKEVLELIYNQGNWDNKLHAQIKLALPKFDVVSNINLIDGLKALGIEDIFDARLSDFSPMCEESDEIWMNEAKHAARVTVDEKGCVAAAYTIMAMNDGAAIPTEKIDFVLNRPFLFVITGADGAVLFMGVVQEP